MVAIKHQQKPVYDIYEYLKKKIMIKDKNSMHMGWNLFSNNNDKLNNVDIARNRILKSLSVI